MDWGRTLDGAACREVGHSLERGDVLRSAIRVPRVIDSVHTNEDLGGAEHLGPGKGVGEEDRVSGRDVGYGNSDAHLVVRTILRYGLVTRQGRPAEGAEVDVHDDVLAHAELSRDASGRLDFHGVPLAIAKGHCVRGEARMHRIRKQCRGVEASTEENDRWETGGGRRVHHRSA